MTLLDTVDQVLARRRRFWENGYRPLEVWSPDQKVNDKGEPLNSPGKQPRGKWREDAAKKPPEAARARPDVRALNTGILSGHVVGVDVDILDQDIADRIVRLVETSLGTTPLVRIGRPPKTLLVYRTGQPFAKIATPELFMPDGSKTKVEVLAEGQQFVADGIHPDTGQPYFWTDGSPESVPKDALPLISEPQARAIIAAAEQIIREAGGKEKARERPHTPSGPNGHDTHRNGNGGDFFAKVRAAALSDIAAWARALFPRARLESGTGAWRVSSKDLGRHLEEDISIHPAGIQDFGEEEPLTAIDLVLRYGGAGSPLEAALWLCDRLRIDPSTLGYIPAPRLGEENGSTKKASGHDTEGVTLSDFRAYMPQHSYIFVPTREPWPAASVNARIPPVPLVDANGRPVLDDKSEKKTVSASRWLDQNQSVAQMTWAPGEPLLIENRLIDDGGWVERNNIT